MAASPSQDREAPAATGGGEPTCAAPARASRKRRRADGTLRPTVRRHRARQRAAHHAAQRAEWLAQFASGARDRFFHHVDLKDAVFLAGFTKATGLERADAAALLERTANERRWQKLRTLDGTVVGIAPPRPARVAVGGEGRSEPGPSLGGVGGVAPASTMPSPPTASTPTREATP